MSTIAKAPQLIVAMLLASSVACSNAKHDTTTTSDAAPSAAPVTTPPAPRTKAKPLTEGLQRGLEGYDANNNGVLDPEEKEKMASERKARIDALKARINARYDRNHNGVLEPAEEQAMQADTDKLSVFKGAALRRFDANHNGVLDPNEKERMVTQREAFLKNMQAKLAP